MNRADFPAARRTLPLRERLAPQLLRWMFADVWLARLAPKPCSNHKPEPLTLPRRCLSCWQIIEEEP